MMRALNTNVEHRMLRVLWSGNKARYRCGHNGPWCCGAPSGALDHRAFKSADAETRELHECHVKIEQCARGAR